METHNIREGTTERELPWIVSVDDHVVEPPHVWQTWLPEKYRAEGPRVERKRIAEIRHVGGGYFEFDEAPDAPWADCWFFGSYTYVHKHMVVLLKNGENTADERTMTGVTYDDMRPGCYDPKARVDDMELNHVEASLCFPQMTRFCGQIFFKATTDTELGLACVQAYNDWMVEEWCGDSGGRLLPLCMVPLWDAQLAADEVRRNAARGVRAVTFSEIPYFLGLPSIHSREWDPFFQACEDTGTVICMHIGSSSQMPATSPDAPGMVAAALSFGNAMSSINDFLFSGVLVRHPKLKLAYSEGQIGWIPYVLERADDVWETHRGWGGSDIPEPPSYYYYRQIFGCFFKDHHGLESLARVGEDNVTFETDYPHADGTFPHTAKIITEMTAHLTDAQVHKIVRGNAIRMLGLDLEDRAR